jgi:hypothetical protein
MMKNREIESVDIAEKQRELLTRNLGRTLNSAGFDRVGIKGEEEAERPLVIHSSRTGRDYMPDITAKKNGVVHIMQVETTETLTSSRSRHQMKVFANYADSQGSLYCIAVPEGCRSEADKLLVEQGVFANIIELPPENN